MDFRVYFPMCVSVCVLCCAFFISHLFFFCVCAGVVVFVHFPTPNMSVIKFMNLIYTRSQQQKENMYNKNGEMKSNETHFFMDSVIFH